MKNINQKKYINALLFFIENCNNKHLDEIKLDKLFYYLDFVCYRDRKKSVTGDIYIHKKFGATPNMINFIKSKAIELKLIRITINIARKEKYFLLKKPSLTCFNRYEKDLLDKICKNFKLYSTVRILDQTLFEAPWFYSKLYEKIDYNYASDIDII